MSWLWHVLTFWWVLSSLVFSTMNFLQDPRNLMAKSAHKIPGSTSSSAFPREFGKLWPSWTLWTAMSHGLEKVEEIKGGFRRWNELYICIYIYICRCFFWWRFFLQFCKCVYMNMYSVYSYSVVLYLVYIVCIAQVNTDIKPTMIQAIITIPLNFTQAGLHASL